MRLFRGDEEQSNDDRLLVAAVERGDAATVRERLEAGAFVDSCHPTGHSSLMIAAVNGNREIFEMLLDAGADPYVQYGGMGLTALDEAAAMGRSEIVEVWLQRNLEVNLADGVGNTPLMAAAAAGHIDIVRRLLVAGADVQARTVDGITAYSVAKHGRQHDVVAVLREAGARFEPNDPLLAELATIEPAADQSLFQDVLHQLAEVFGRAAKRWEQHEEVHEFEADLVESTQWHQLRERVNRHGFQLVHSRPDSSGGAGTFLLFPTNDKYSVIQAFGTDGGTCNLSTQKIIAWLRKLDKKQPFYLTGCGHDFLAGRFLSPVKNVDKLATAIYRFCPDIVDQGCGTVARLAQELERSQEFVFWWD
jgi:Domain of unknown function (DUF4253)/Ankyrin repeats (3 copies)